MKIYFVLLLVLPPVFVVSFLAWASYPWTISQKSFEGEIQTLAHVPSLIDEDITPAVLKVVTWNMGYAYGLGSEGRGYEQKEDNYFKERLQQMGVLLQKSEADIVFLQEIDFDSKRSGYMDQAQTLAEIAGYRHLAYAPSWVANYIPFPYMPVKNHFGHINSGGAILSKYPIVKNTVELLGKPESQAWWYNLFYLHRYLQTVEVKLGDKSITAVNLHLEAFDRSNREKQAAHLAELIETGKVDLVAGDFNMVPTEAAKKTKFPDGDDNYENDMSYDLLKKTSLKDVIPEDIYGKNESLYWTYPTDRANRKLDYIFYKEELRFIKVEVLLEASTLSDHFPMRASFQLGAAQFNPYSQ